MKQTCLTRSTEDAAALLGQGEIIMNAIRNAPLAEADEVFDKTPGVTLKSFDGETAQIEMGAATGLDVLTSPTAVEIHTAQQGSYTIELMPDRSRGIDEIVAAALQDKPRSPNAGGPGLNAKKGMGS